MQSVCRNVRFVLSMMSLLLVPASAASTDNPLTEQQPSTLSMECQGFCPRILMPVCATDGAAAFQYFHNECLMHFDACRTGKVWYVVEQLALCQEPLARQLVRDISQRCMRPCPYIYDPLCATNGKSHQVFGNDCVLDVENCLDAGKWSKTRDDDCGL